ASGRPPPLLDARHEPTAPRTGGGRVVHGAWRSGADLGQAEALARALDRHLGHLPDAGDVELVVQDVRLQGGPLRGRKRVPEPAVGDRDRRRTVDHLEYVLGFLPSLMPVETRIFPGGSGTQ